jgi:hypothetical protein
MIGAKTGDWARIAVATDYDEVRPDVAESSNASLGHAHSTDCEG